MMKRVLSAILVILVIAAVIPLSSFAVEVNDAINPVVFNGHSYLYIANKMNWHDAKSYCERVNGHLVTITNAEENAFVVSISPETVMIGLTDEESEGEWKWVTGEPYMYNNFAAGEPNNERNEDYVLLRPDSQDWNDGHLNQEKWPFICEWDTTSVNVNLSHVPVLSVVSQGHKYELYDEVASWHEAKQICENLGGYLACITSQVEQTVLANLISNGSQLNYWLGASDENEEGNWQWITGERWHYTHWGGNNPDNGHGGTEHYLGFSNNRTGWGGIYEWNDFRDIAFADFGFICEYNYVNDGSYDSALQKGAHSAFVRQHLNFISDGEYQTAIDNTWARTIAGGLNNFRANFGDYLDNLIRTPYEAIQGQSLSITENPYDTILPLLLVQQSDGKDSSFESEFLSNVLDIVSQLMDLCKMANVSWSLGPDDMKPNLDKMLNAPDDLAESNPAVYNFFRHVATAISDGKIKEDTVAQVLNVYQVADNFRKGMDDINKITEWISNSVAFDASVSAYLKTSQECKQTLEDLRDELIHEVDTNLYYNPANPISLFPSRFANSVKDFEDALNKYLAYESEARIADVMYQNFIEREKNNDAIHIFSQIYAETAVATLGSYLDNIKLKGSWVFACVQAYKFGMTFSDAFTANDKIADCRRLAEPYGFLEYAAIQVLEHDKASLLADETYERALKFDSSFALLRNIEREGLKNYHTLLDYNLHSIAGLTGREDTKQEVSLVQTEQKWWNNILCHAGEYYLEISGPDEVDGIDGIVVASFVDVPPTLYCYDSVMWAVKSGITNGTSNSSFSPDRTCTNSHILTFLWRNNGCPEPQFSNSFRNVSENAYYAKAAQWAKEHGLVEGSIFDGDTPCTRASAVTYMWKLVGSPEYSYSAFKDVPNAAPYAKAVAWAVAKGITNGTSSDTFSPDRLCTRGHIVAFLYRYSLLNIHPSGDMPFKQVLLDSSWNNRGLSGEKFAVFDINNDGMLEVAVECSAGRDDNVGAIYYETSSLWESLFGYSSPLPPKTDVCGHEQGSYEITLAQQPWRLAQTSLTNGVF